MSLSTGKRDYFELFHELADEAYFRRIVLVSAVNNVDSPSYPLAVCLRAVVAAHAGKARSSSTTIRILRWNSAPGIDIEVPWLNGGTIEATGNSCAARTSPVSSAGSSASTRG